MRMRLLVIGHYGGHNTGDEAMLAALVDSLRSLESHLVVITRDGAAPSYFRGKHVSAIPPEFGEVFREVRRSHGVILGGGTHFHDDYRFWRYARHLRYMLRIVGVSWLARAWGKRVGWLSVGFGPFSFFLTRWVTALGLMACDVVVVRDKASLNRIRKWVSPDKVRLSFDVAALLGEYILHGKGTREGSLLGISVTSFHKSRSGGPEKDQQFWKEFAAALSEILREKPSLRVRVFVFRGGSRESDVNLSIQLYQRLACVDPSRVEFVKYHPDPRETFRMVAECEAFIATRYHSAVLAYVGGCRLLLIPYHAKVKDIAREIKLSRQALLSLDMKKEEIRRRALHLLEGHDDSFLPALPRKEAIEKARENIIALAKLLNERRKQ